MHILLIEDDCQATEYLVKGLGECGHVVDHAANGEDGLHLALTGCYDVIVADRLLPKRDGLSVVRMLRADRNATPVPVLSALGEVDDCVAGLRAGRGFHLFERRNGARIIAWPKNTPPAWSIFMAQTADSQNRVIHF